MDSCVGDTGGPLITRENSSDPWYQIGVNSYGTAKCGIEQPAVYTKVTNYLQWIDDNLKE